MRVGAGTAILSGRRLACAVARARVHRPRRLPRPHL